MSSASTHADPYDELPYRSRPVEWAAPERLALCSLLHGGPRAPTRNYRVLELGCGDGANLLPLAFYRPHAEFVGVDASRHAIAVARHRQAELVLPNLRFVHADFAQAERELSGRFDFILVHGVLSWVDAATRDRLLDLCATRLAGGGLLYLNYNTKPGWTIRGLVRDFLRAQTAQLDPLALRTKRAQEIAASSAGMLAGSDHPYSQLMANEYRFVSESDPSYVAHEFLAPENHAYWRSEMHALLAARGLSCLADADYNYAQGRVPEQLPQQLEQLDLHGQPLEDTADLFVYRQLHSPLITQLVQPVCPPSREERLGLVLASTLARLPDQSDGPTRFRHPLGHEVEVREAPLAGALTRIAGLWPRGVRVGELLQPGAAELDDLELLHRHGMVELRLDDPFAWDVDPAALRRCEPRWGGYFTDASHRHHLAPP